MRETTEGRFRALTWCLLLLLGMLAGSALLPARWVFAAPGDAYGPGLCGDDTTRTCEATNSLLGVAATALAAAIGTPDSAVPTKVVMTGYKAQAIGGVMGAVTALDAVSPKATLQGVPMATLVLPDGSAGLSVNSGATDAATLRVAANLIPGQNGVAGGAGDQGASTLQTMPAADSSSTGSICGTIAAGAADLVIAVRPGKQHTWLQVGLDPDGPIRVEMGATTTNCSLGEYVASGTATTHGEQWISPPGYSGQVAVCSVAGTVSYCYGEAIY